MRADSGGIPSCPDPSPFCFSYYLAKTNREDNEVNSNLTPGRKNEPFGQSHKPERKEGHRINRSLSRPAGGQEPEGHPPREAGKWLITQGDKLSQRLGGSSLPDCEVKTELSETGRCCHFYCIFPHFFFFFLIWKCSRGAGKCRLENSRGLRGRNCVPVWLSV